MLLKLWYRVIKNCVHILIWNRHDKSEYSKFYTKNLLNTIKLNYYTFNYCEPNQNVLKFYFLFWLLWILNSNQHYWTEIIFPARKLMYNSFNIGAIFQKLSLTIIEYFKKCDFLYIFYDIGRPLASKTCKVSCKYLLYTFMDIL